MSLFGGRVAGIDYLHTKNFQLQDEGTYNGLQAYKNSKVCNLLFTYHLAELLRGTRVRVTAIDPGISSEKDIYFEDNNLQLM